MSDGRSYLSWLYMGNLIVGTHMQNQIFIISHRSSLILVNYPLDASKTMTLMIIYLIIVTHWTGYV